MASSICNWCAPLCAAAIVLLAPAPRARAAPPLTTEPPAAKQAAEAKLMAGVDLLKARNYREALARFEEAYALVPSPLIFYDIGLARRGLGDDPRALESFERFLAEAPEAPADKRRRADGYRDELRARVSVVTLEANVGAADLTVDGVDLGRVSFPRRLYLGPGPHELVARAGGAAQVATLSCSAGEALAFTVRLSSPVPAPSSVVPLPLQQPRVAEETPRAPGTVEVLQSAPAKEPAGDVRDVRPWALSAAAVGVASLGAGLAFGLEARDAGDAVTSDSQSGRTFVPTDETAGRRDQTVEVVLLSVGAVALAAGVGLYVWANHRAHGAEGRP
jgi:hypothetical protein